MKEDPIVEEIRAIRRKHAERLNFDLIAIVKDIQLQEKESKLEFAKRPYRKAIIWETRKSTGNK